MLTEENKNLQKDFEEVTRRKAMVFDKAEFARLIINDLNKNYTGRRFLNKYTQSEVRDIIEQYRVERNQWKLRDISKILYIKSPEYQRLIRYFAEMSLFSYVLTPIRDISKGSKSKVLKQYIEVAQMVKMMNLRHEMYKLLKIAFRDDVFYGYIYKDSKSFYIQSIDADICKITSIDDGVYNFSIDMTYFMKDERRLIGFADEVKQKYLLWKKTYGERKIDPQVQSWYYVELDPRNTICIKINEEILECFPPFAGSFDAIFDIQAFKELRKNKEEIGNYMLLAQELPIRKESEDNNDFLIDKDMFMYFHNLAVDTVPDRVGVITSPMPLTPINFQKDAVDFDGVAKATRDYWNGNGTSQLLFNSDTSTSQGLLMSIKTDEEIVFGVVNQIQTWLNRYLRYQFSDLMFNAKILEMTWYNQKEMFDMYMQASTVGVPVKSHLSASVGLEPIETMNMAYLENDILKMHEQWIPVISSHTQGANPIDQGGRPPASPQKQSDETMKGKDKPNGN